MKIFGSWIMEISYCIKVKYTVVKKGKWIWIVLHIFLWPCGNFLDADLLKITLLTYLP